MGIRKKASLLFITIFVTAFVIVGISTIFIVKKYIIEVVSNNLKSISAIQLTRIESINAQNTERLNLISSRTQLRINLDNYNKNHQEKYQRKMNTILEDARLSVNDFDQISILNLRGEIVASTDSTLLGEQETLDFIKCYYSTKYRR